MRRHVGNPKARRENTQRSVCVRERGGDSKEEVEGDDDKREGNEKDDKN